MPDIHKDAIRITPQEGPQTRFLQSSADVVFYGGSAGGGKTYALLLDPLYQYNNSKFGAVIFRRTTKQITNEGGLWDTASDLYSSIGAKMLESPINRAVFPSKMQVAFSHMEYEKNRFDWQGSQIPWIGFDEITHFTWKQFVYMLSRNRSDSGVPGRMLGTCNPDPDSWVRRWIDWWIGDDGFAIPDRSGVVRWFIVDGEDVIWDRSKQALLRKYPKSLPKSFTFIRSSVYDNKILLEKDPGYLANLHALTRVERAQLLDGNWNIRPTAGSYFKRSDFDIVDAVPVGKLKVVRAWDLAATKRTETAVQKEKKATDPDWTAGVKMSRDPEDGIYYIEHVERFREDAPKVAKSIKAIAKQDGRRVKVRFPQDPGQAGKSQAKGLSGALAGYPVCFYPVSGSKEHRATPFAAQCQAGNVKIVRGPWNEAFLSELENFPEGIHDDQVDAGSDAFDELTNAKRAGTW